MSQPKLSKRVLFFLKKYILPTVIYMYIKLLELTTKIKLVNEPEGLRGSKIYASWHGRLYGFGALKPRDKLNILISQSRDGELISQIVGSFGIKSVRGSSYRGAISAAKQILKLVKEEKDIVFAVDGPRGPIYEVKEGIIRIAQLAEVPIIPLVGSCKNKKIFKSWDRFNLPLPFNDATVVFGEPIRISKDVGEGKLEEYRLKLEETLKDLAKRADDYYKNK